MAVGEAGRTHKVRTLASWFGAALLIGWTLVPILWLVLSSFKPERIVYAMPPAFVFTPELTHYRAILLNPDFTRSFMNSAAIAVCSTLIVLALTVPAAYAHVHLRFRRSAASLLGLVAIRAMPPVAVVVPLYLGFRTLRLLDTYSGVTLLYTCFFASFAVLMLKSFFDEVPHEVDEAAAMDGGTPLRRLWSIHLPPVAPGLAAAAVLTFVSSWNEFFFAFVFTARQARTVPVALAMFVGETGIDWGAMAAGATLAMLPSLVLAWFVQRYFVKGLMAGSVR